MTTAPSPPLEAADIERLLPHRAPWRLLDRVPRFEPGASLEAVRTVPPDGPLTAGHFPGFPLLPGVLLFEAMAQAAALLFALTYGPPQPGEVPVLGAVDGRLLAAVFPGDVVEVHVDAERMTSTAGLFQARARVGARTVGRGSLSLAKTSAERLRARGETDGGAA